MAKKRSEEVQFATPPRGVWGAIKTSRDKKLFIKAATLLKEYKGSWEKMAASLPFSGGWWAKIARGESDSTPTRIAFDMVIHQWEFFNNAAYMKQLIVDKRNQILLSRQHTSDLESEEMGLIKMFAEGATVHV